MGKQIIVGGVYNPPSTSTTEYNMVQGGCNWGTEPYAILIVPTDGTFSHLHVVLGSAPGEEKSLTFTFRLNGDDTSLTATMQDTNNTCTDSTHTVSVSAGDEISLKCVPSGTPTASSYCRWYFIFEPDDGTSTIQMGIIASLGLNGYFLPVPGYRSTGSTTESYNHTVSSLSGTVKNLYISLTVAPGEGKSRTFTFRHNGSNTSLSATVNDDRTIANDTSNSVEITSSSYWSIYHGYSGAGATTLCRISFVIDVDTEGESLICGGIQDYTKTANRSQEYTQLHRNIMDLYGSQDNRYITILNSEEDETVTIKNFRTKINSTPNLGNSITFSVITVEEESSAILSATLSNYETDDTDTSEESISPNDEFTMRYEIAGTLLNGKRGAWGFTAYMAPEQGYKKGYLNIEYYGAEPVGGPKPP